MTIQTEPIITNSIEAVQDNPKILRSYKLHRETVKMLEVYAAFLRTDKQQIVETALQDFFKANVESIPVSVDFTIVLEETKKPTTFDLEAKSVQDRISDIFGRLQLCGPFEWSGIVWDFQRAFPKLVKQAKKLNDPDTTRMLEEVYEFTHPTYEGVCANCKTRQDKHLMGKCPLEIMCKAENNGVVIGSEAGLWLKQVFQEHKTKDDKCNCPRFDEYFERQKDVQM